MGEKYRSWFQNEAAALTLRNARLDQLPEDKQATLETAVYRLGSNGCQTNPVAVKALRQLSASGLGSYETLKTIVKSLRQTGIVTRRRLP